ncbi:hypothetical protein [Ekhidna sp.]|uniref:hypothetical protein n=1 Tax=Ekhidna sp. TaxID=2608089 RepID=UPI003BAA4A9B
MTIHNKSSRRAFFKSSAFGLLAVSFPGFANDSIESASRKKKSNEDALFYRYPALDDESVAGVVGASHGRFDKVKELVEKRPELAKASWDWGFGDFESAIGAAAHMGQKEIIRYLIQKGARPDIFTYATLGEIDAVKAMIAATPGIERIHGPHGITLMEHARSGLWDRNISAKDKSIANEMIAYLKTVEGSHQPALDLGLTLEEQKVYFGEYRWGPADDEVFYADLNMRKLLQFGRKGTFGRSLNRVGDHMFTPDGAPSVKIKFKVEGDKAIAVTIHEPNPILTATRI